MDYDIFNATLHSRHFKERNRFVLNKPLQVFNTT